MSTTTPAFRMADRLLDGRLADRLRQYRAEQPPVSWYQIARRLYDEAGVEVTPGTLHQWHSELTTEATEAAS